MTHVEIYTDGACRGNPGPGCWGAILVCGSHERELSGGEKRRVALARALVNRPTVIIADEPTGNIDPAMSFEMMNLLLKINQAENMTIVVITHQMDLVNTLNKRVITIRDGVVVSDKIGGAYDGRQ